MTAATGFHPSSTVNRASGAEMADEVEESEILDQSGRVLGPRARATRDRILAATRDLLDEESLRELRVSDIARRVGASPATFYQYFQDVEDAVLCLAKAASDEMPKIFEHISGDWEGEAGLQRARRLADAFVCHWDAHHAALRVRNMAADEGDARFLEVRRRAMSPLLAALAEQITENQGSNTASMDTPLHPHAAAAAMAAILERLAAYHRELEGVGVTREHLVETTARIVHRTVTGRGD